MSVASRSSTIKKGDMTKLFQAVREAGFAEARIVIHPDGRIEAAASSNDTSKPSTGENSWDDVLK